MMPPSVPSITARDAATALGLSGPSGGADGALAGPLLVDVREADEYAAERVDGAVLLPISQFVARFQELPQDRPLLMLCAAGSRSTSATMYLLQNGWTDVRNITGGMIGWRHANLPIRTGPVEPGEGDL